LRYCHLLGNIEADDGGTDPTIEVIFASANKVAMALVGLQYSPPN